MNEKDYFSEIQAMAKRAHQKIVLTFLSGKHKAESIKLRRDATIIGREKGDIQIEDSEMSATHCQIQAINEAFHIFDMNSTNGTFLNGERVIKARLKDQDIVKLGNTTFRINFVTESAARDVPTVFKVSKKDLGKSSSLIETLIESEIQNTPHQGLKLAMTFPNGKTDEVIVRQRMIYIGRASSFANFEQDTEISRKHLLIKINNSGEIFIEDQGSTNGTFVNSKPVKGMFQIKSGDEVRIGDTRIRVTLIN